MGGRGEEDGGKDGELGWTKERAIGDAGRVEMGGKRGVKDTSSSKREGGLRSERVGDTRETRLKKKETAKTIH